jgi:hypothetical protein
MGGFVNQVWSQRAHVIPNSDAEAASLKAAMMTKPNTPRGGRH